MLREEEIIEILRQEEQNVEQGIDYNFDKLKFIFRNLDGRMDDYKIIKWIYYLCNRYSCEDAEWFADVIVLHDLFTAGKLSFIKAFIVWLKKDYGSKISCQEAKAIQFSKLILQYQNEKQGILFTVPGNKSPEPTCFNNVLYLALICGNYELLSMFVKAGSESFKVHGEREMGKLCCFCGRSRCIVTLGYDDANSPFEYRMYNLLGAQRENVVQQIVCLLVATCLEPVFKDHYARCLKLYFESVTDPIPTCQEIEKNKHSKVNIVHLSKELVNIFPESIQPYGPRRLKHLSRCQIRRSLKREKFLSEEVSTLEIPDTLKPYLLFEE